MKNRIAWAPQSNPVVGAVWMPKAGITLPEEYDQLLAERLQWMLEREPDPETSLAFLISGLQSDDLLLGQPNSLESAGQQLVQDEHLQARLSQMGIPGRLPKEFKGSARTEEILLRTTVEQWLTAVSERPPESSEV